MGNWANAAFAKHEANHRSKVMHDTWGHLAPEPRKPFIGHILWTYSDWGIITPIRSMFEGLSESPWLFEALTDFISEKSKKQGGIYRFDGTVMMCKNGKFKFSGKVRAVKI